MTELDRSLINLVRREPRPRSGLDFEQSMAVNVLKRRGVKPKVLMAVFKVGKNTIYYRALTGTGESYPASTAIQVNEEVERIGVDEAERLYVKDWMKEAVNRENALIAKRIRNRKQVRRAA